MKSRLIVPLAAFLVLLSGVASANLSAAANTGYYFDFDKTLKPWLATGHGQEGYQTLDRVPGDSVCNGPLTDYNAILQAGKAHTNGAVQHSNNKSEAPLPVGTWMGADLATASGVHIVSVTLYARSERNCVGCYPLIYAGAKSPTHITQLQDVSEGKYLKYFWQEYEYASKVDVPDRKKGQGIVHVALGWSGTDAAIAIDCLNIQITSEP